MISWQRAKHSHTPLIRLFTKHLDGLCSHLLQVHAQALQDACCDTFTLAHQAEQEMFSTNVMMIQAASFIDGKLNHLLGTRSQTNLAQDDAISPANDVFNGAPNFVEFDAEVTQHFGSYALTFAHQTEQEMFRPNVIVLESLGFFLSEAQDFSCSLCKLIKPISIVHLFVTPLSVAEGGTEPSVMLR